MSFHEAQFYTNRRNDGAVAIYNGLVKVVRRHLDRARGKQEETHIRTLHVQSDKLSCLALFITVFTSFAGVPKALLRLPQKDLYKNVF